MTDIADHQPRLLLTIPQAAARLGVGRSTMYGLVLDGAVESVTIGRLRRIPADALPRFLATLRGDHNTAQSA
ncbi:MAG: helix-turn-helix domain-containing protein [Kineosporiaceae bacterium]|nr:helix-turn-helix domain-containing protein [Kineosporiaceae bacterium]